jgi:rhamnosyltransferase
MNSSLPSRLNTCIVVVTYNPDLGFSDNLMRHLAIVDKVIIIDNNSTDVDINIFLKNEYIKNIHLINSKKNNGIAWALNKGIIEAINMGYKWIVTFDQDSFPNINLLEYYSSVLKSEKNIGLLGTQFSVNEEKITEINWKKSLTLITSGTLHPIEIFDTVGFYNEKLFIDSVDFDFALRVKLSGYDVVRIEIPLIIHKLGNPVRKYGLESSNHNLIRRYYYSRNHFFLTKTYFKKFPIWIIKKNYFFIKSILLLIIVEDKVSKKLKNILKGLSDGYKGF